MEHAPFFNFNVNCRLYIDSVQASSAAGFAWFSRICNRYTSFRAALDSEELVCNRDVVRSLHEGYPKCLNVINHKNISFWSSLPIGVMKSLQAANFHWRYLYGSRNIFTVKTLGGQTFGHIQPSTIFDSNWQNQFLVPPKGNHFCHSSWYIPWILAV